MIQHRKQQFSRKNFPRRPLVPRLRSWRRDLRPSPGEEAAELIGNADGFGGLPGPQHTDTCRDATSVCLYNIDRRSQSRLRNLMSGKSSGARHRVRGKKGNRRLFVRSQTRCNPDRLKPSRSIRTFNGRRPDRCRRLRGRRKKI
jgi:hypothetical protein